MMLRVEGTGPDHLAIGTAARTPPEGLLGDGFGPASSGGEVAATEAAAPPGWVTPGYFLQNASWSCTGSGDESPVVSSRSADSVTM